jgi:hypothetical protein
MLREVWIKKKITKLGHGSKFIFGPKLNKFFLAIKKLLFVLKEARKELKELKSKQNLGCLLPFFFPP